MGRRPGGATLIIPLVHLHNTHLPKNSTSRSASEVLLRSTSFSRIYLPLIIGTRKSLKTLRGGTEACMNCSTIRFTTPGEDTYQKQTQFMRK
jgi:hypothetical protein